MPLNNLRCILTCAFLICILVLNKSFALEVLFSRYSVSDGLSSNLVNCVWQDPRGLMWIGSENGLQRYDGTKFVDFYRNSNSRRLPSAPVHQILEDHQGRMWIRMGGKIGTFNTFNYTFHEARILSSKPLPPRAEFYLRRDYQGNFLLTVHKVGIFVYNARKHAFEINKSKIYVPEDMGINHAFEDRKTGNFWFSTDKGLALFNYKSKKLLRPGQPGFNQVLASEPGLSNGVTHVHIDNKRRYWIVSWAGDSLKTFCFDEKTNTFTSENSGLSSESGYFEIANFKESRGIVWAYGLHFLKIYDSAEKSFIKFYNNNPNYGINFNTINHIFEDKKNNVWVATDNGLYVANVIFHEARHGVIPKIHHEDAVTSILQTSDSHMLFGTWGMGVKALKVTGDVYNSDPIYQKLFNPSDKLRGGPFDMIWDMIESKQDKSIWLSCQEGRLIHVNPRTGGKTYLEPKIFLGSTVRQIEEDARGNLWFGTQSGKIIVLPLNSRKENLGFRLLRNLKAPIVKLYCDKSGLLWAGTQGGGLFAFDLKTGKMRLHVSAEEKSGQSLSSNHVKDVLQLNDSIYFLATGNLDVLNVKTKAVRQLSIYDGLPFNSVSSFQLDIKGDLWLSTVGGICTYNIKRNVFREYDQRDGLITTTSFDNLLETSLSRKDNRLIFAGGNYFVDFDPKLIKDRNRPDRVTITDFKVFNNALPVDSILKLERLELKNTQNSISIEFASLNYNHSRKLTYYYMLEGADKNWIKSDGPVAANYSYLRPGSYTFRVKSINSEGIETRSITSLPIYIEPAFWESRWFMLLISIIIASIIYSAYLLRLNQVLEVQKIRERVARDLHDDMGSTLSTINILSEMAKVKIQDNARAAESYLVKISENSVRMMDSMDDIVWSIKPSNDSILKITARMREFASGILEPKNIDYYFTIDEDIKDRTLNMEARRDLFLIFKESINNVAKYSQATEARISLYKFERKLILRIDDDGVGFDLATAETGNGLNNLKKRTEKLKGKFSIKSAPGSGTRVCVELPLT